jgi:acetyltransferase
VLSYERHHPLDAIFRPQNVAVIGATERAGSVGRTVLWNLISHPFGGTVFPVNLKRSSVMGIKAYPNVATVPEPVDLAVVATPARTVPGIIGECADAGVKSAIVVSSGFKEIGTEGAELERQILEEACRGQMRIIGPNCLGVMSPITGLNATFASDMAQPGNVGFISQSGALCTAVLDWSFRENFGFSTFISIGSMIDVGWSDLIDYLGDDPHTESILIYMETVGDARSFLSAAREVALTKPIIVIKSGRTQAAARAAVYHTGALTGSDEVLDAAFRRCGVLRVDSLADLFSMAEVLAKQPRPKGPRLTILTNAGGPGVLATDALIANGGELAELSEETVKALNRLLPPHWSHSNPVDIGSDAGPERYAKAFEIAAEDPNSDGLLVILAPQAMTDPTQTAERLRYHGETRGKPFLASWMGGAGVAAGERILNQTNIPTFPYPDTAARMFDYMWQYSSNLHSLYETPVLPADFEEGTPDRAQAEKIIQTARQSGRTILTEFESKAILDAYNIPTVQTRVATGEADAVRIADDIGYYELIIGSSLDSQFGPVLLFGSGGELVEVHRDRALGLPPLNTTLARRMMERTAIYTVLEGMHGREPVDLAALEQLLVRFSQLVVEQRWIKEIDINPLLASPERIIALDARVVLHELHVGEAELPKLAICPYPIQYVSPWTMKNGTLVTIRPIRPEDEPLMVKFNETLSNRSVYFRYFHPVKLSQRVGHERMTRICFIDYDREMALVAECKNPDTGEREILGIGRLSKLHAVNEAEFGILVRDAFQGLGLGSELLRRLLQVGRDENLGRITAEILPENHIMLAVCKKFGFNLCHSFEEGIVRAAIDL